MSSFDHLVLNDNIDFEEVAQEPKDVRLIVSPSHYRDATIAYIKGEGAMGGARLPWTKTHDLIAFRPGEVTLWMGINGHGKSLVTSQVMLDFTWQDQVCCVASYEMKPPATLGRMAKQGATHPNPTDGFVDAFIAHATGKLWLYDKQGRGDADDLLKVIRYCKRKLGVTQFFADSLMKLVAHEDDYNGQKMFVDEACSMARDEGVHIHIVHHSRKLADENQVPGKMDSKGSGSIVDQVDQCITVFRNKKKERLVESGKATEEDMNFPDAYLIVDKNRHGSWEGRIGLYYTPGAMSYSESPRLQHRYTGYDRWMDVARENHL